jgi:hypothetical protein
MTLQQRRSVIETCLIAALIVIVVGIGLSVGYWAGALSRFLGL